VECLLEELYSQGLLENEMEMNKIEEEMVTMLKRLFSDEDKAEILDARKWK